LRQSVKSTGDGAFIAVVTATPVWQKLTVSSRQSAYDISKLKVCVETMKYLTVMIFAVLLICLSFATLAMILLGAPSF
jgi:hypothetical protein